MPDITAVSATPIQAYQDKPASQTGNVVRPAGAGKEDDPEHAKLRKATREMESYFVSTLLKKMHESSSKGGLFGQDSEASTYRDMFDDAIGKEIGKTGSFGIADMLYKEFVVQLEGPKR